MTGVWKSYPSALESEGRDASDGDVELEAEVALEVGCARGRSLHSVVRMVSAREKTRRTGRTRVTPNVSSCHVTPVSGVIHKGYGMTRDSTHSEELLHGPHLLVIQPKRI